MSEVQHIITAAPFTPVNLEPIFFRAEQLRIEDHDKAKRRENASKFIGARAVNIFYGESTRTMKSFELAEVALGVGYASTPNAGAFSAAAKGETLAHTVEVMEQYNPDLIVLRHDHEAGSAEAAALLKHVHLINGGDKGGEHPTQAMLDAYTIKDEIGRLDNLQVTFMGDLRFGRTIRSLVHVLAKGEGNHFNFVSHPDFSLSEDIKHLLDTTKDVSYDEYFHTSELGEILPQTDVFYVTRTQTNLGATKLGMNEFRVTAEVANLLPEHSILMHPMPIDRLDLNSTEIAPEVDRHPRARFYRQAGNGLYIRMALIERMLEGKSVLG